MRVILVTFALLAGVAVAQPPFFFVQMADPQFGMYTNDESFEQETANFEFAIATANRLKPAFVIVCGDLINKPGDAAQTEEYKRIAANLSPDIPLYNVSGNHDVGNEPAAESLALYRERFGPDYYTFRAGDLAGFVLNSSLISAPKNVPEEAAKQESWLAGELEKAHNEGAKHLVVFLHHSFFLKEAAEADQYFNIPGPARQRYLELLQKYGVTHVFAGHYHRNALARTASLEMVTSGPVGKPLGTDSRSGFRIVTIRNGAIEHKYYDFGNLPNQVP